MPFAKAEPKQARVKIGMYGPPGSGKTMTALLWAEGIAEFRGKRIAFVDTERGTDFYAQTIPDREVHPDAFDFDALYTRSLSETLDCVLNLDPNEHGVIVIDSITHMWDAAVQAYEGKLTANETIPINAWGTIKRPYKALVKFLMDCPMDVIIIGRQKTIFKTVNGQMEYAGVGMRAEGETQFEPHINLRLENVVSKSDSTKSMSMVYVEKDRSGILGKTLRNSTFADVAPLLKYLGAEQGSTELDEEERLAKDGELFDQAKAADDKKLAKSAELFSELHSKLSVCTTMDELAQVGATIKKQKRYLVDKHKAALRVTYEELRSRIVNDQTPDPC